MKLFYGFRCFFDRVSREIKRIKFKQSLIFALIFLVIGIVDCIISGSINPIFYMYILPKSTLSLPLFYIFWFVSLLFCGVIFSGILNVEKFRKNNTFKVILCVALMMLFTYISYPLFFISLAHFFTIVSLLCTMLFCLYAIILCKKISFLWTMCLSIHFLWLLYNFYICIAISIIN